MASNQLLAAVLFFPWIKPRETVCGLMGRWAAGTGRKARFAQQVGPALERAFHKHETCDEIYRKEEAARGVLYS